MPAGSILLHTNGVLGVSANGEKPWREPGVLSEVCCGCMLTFMDITLNGH